MHRRFSQLTKVRRDLAAGNINGVPISTARIQIENSDVISFHNQGAPYDQFDRAG
jgi:hypothetical protein